MTKLGYPNLGTGSLRTGHGSPGQDLALTAQYLASVGPDLVIAELDLA